MKFLDSYTVLIVEDEVNVRESLAYLLRTYGADVQSTCNGIEALNFLSQKSNVKVDLIITDIEMPFLNGVELLKKLHKLNLYVPTIVITGYGEKSLVQKLLRIGCEDFLDKPFSKKELKDCLLRTVEKIEKQPSALKIYSDDSLKDKLDTLNRKVDNINDAHKSITNYDSNKYKSVKIWNSSIEELGGDCFFIHEDSNFIYAVIADVAGHDMGASYYTIIVKTVFHQVNSKEFTPIEFIKELEGLLPEIDDSKRMICVMCLRYEKVNHKLSVCSAGVPPLICTSSDCKSLVVPNYIHPPLGIYPLSDIFQEEFSLEDFDKMFLFSDGILNSTKLHRIQEKDSLIGHNLLVNWIYEKLEEGIESTINHIKKNTLRYCRHKQNDDILIVGVDLKEDQNV